MNKFKVIGLMSGTSLDGTDLAACEFTQDHQWHFHICHARTVPYPEKWRVALSSVHDGSALQLAQLHKEYGHYLGRLVKDFMAETGFGAELVASHGHTIFHQPQSGLTFQLGEGSAIAAECGIAVACDFRSADVAMGGQGAPLVPAGDRLLFPGYDYCLNLGGFANISYESEGRRIAHDISPCNMALNAFSAFSGFPYDENGEIARSGAIIDELSDAFNDLEFYRLLPPKSLGREWFHQHFLPLADIYRNRPADVLRTLCEHIATQVSLAILPGKQGKLLITGGGAHNTFLVRRIEHLCNQQLIVPDAILVDFKEALIFAFLGVLRLTGQVNVLCSVTGSAKDHTAGALYLSC
ncbi:MAG: anhydro-N-acetylmuramic acid kinase [Bacteroidetes bacterium]|nr:anhydro-N-acetylmuramic acid kinase [Bacteroidota bacterium]